MYVDMIYWIGELTTAFQKVCIIVSGVPRYRPFAEGGEEEKTNRKILLLFGGRFHKLKLATSLGSMCMVQIHVELSVM